MQLEHKLNPQILKLFFRTSLYKITHLKAGKEGSYYLLLHKLLSKKEVHEAFLNGSYAILGGKFLLVVLFITMRDIYKKKLGKWSYISLQELLFFSSKLKVGLLFRVSFSLLSRGILFFPASEKLAGVIKQWCFKLTSVPSDFRILCFYCICFPFSLLSEITLGKKLNSKELKNRKGTSLLCIFRAPKKWYL